ncbi:hypothetical protein BU15DRAFT_63322 [Melanogaster broomeanus]|nr:hypothetical protein BU15DRAFT_63322 [Melanogaster broomeanus]
MEGTKNVMVATSAFSTGNDYPHVCLVIHLDRPFDMLEFVQGQGRAGRDGRPAKCYLLTPKEAGRPSTKEPGVMTENKVAMYEHVYTYRLKRCLRYGISFYIDGTRVSCRGLGCNQLCCVCLRDPHHNAEGIRIANMPKGKAAAAKNMENRPLSSHVPTPRDSSTPTSVTPQEPFAQAAKRAKQMTSVRQQQKNAKVEDMLTALRRLEDMCCICQVLGKESEEPNHNLYCCPCFGSRLDSNWDKYKEWRKKLCYVKWHNKICWLCHVPQLNDTLHPTFSKTKEGKPDCRFADMVAPVAFAIYHHPSLKQSAQLHFHQRWEDEGSFTRWLMGKPADDRESNLIDLFMWYSSMNQDGA